MFNSLRTRLLIWQVLLLTAVVVAFGSVVFHQWRKGLLSDLDKELLSSAAVLEGTLRGIAAEEGASVPRPTLGKTLGKTLGTGPPKDREGQNFGAKDRAGAPGGSSILAGDVNPDIFDLPHNLAVNSRRSQSTYFVIYDVNDQVIVSSHRRNFRIPHPSGLQQFVDSGSNREIILVGPGQTRILVGRDVEDFNRQSTAFLLWISLIGLGILAVGCIAGYWLTGRAIAPIGKVSQTVQAISGTNLTSRIDTSKMDSEFIQLSDLVNEMLNRLESTIEQQKHFIADASHELRTPVSVIGMHSELALSTDRTTEEYKKTLQTCFRASDRLKSLTEDLLTLAKSDSGNLENSKEKIDLSQLACQSVEFLKPLADQHEVTLVGCAESVATVRGDKRLLRQLIDNLVTNAIVHNRPGGTATITVESGNDGATLQVRDDGPGIPKNEVSKLFDRFYRADKSRSREYGGSGLGLAICQSIAHSHGGKISVRSEPNTETVFELLLPETQFQNPIST